jgi:hypothetical protein
MIWLASLGGGFEKEEISQVPETKGLTNWGPTILAAIIAALIGAGATLIATHWQIQAERERREAAEQQALFYKAKYENAPKMFAKELGTLVENAPAYENAPGTDTHSLNPDPNYRQSIIESARSIVSARDGLRTSLDAIGNRLDSDIDELKSEASAPDPDLNKLVTTLGVLRRKWPSKQAEIEVAVRALLAQLGLVETAPQ